MNHIDQIKKDIPRTLCSSRKKLFWILYEYSKFDQDLGYTQGMNYICALIIHLYPRYSAKKLLNIFKKVMNIKISSEYIVRDMYTNGFPGLVYLLAQLNNLLTSEIKRVLSDSYVQLEHFVPQWFLTMFTCQLSNQTCKKMIKESLSTNSFNVYIEKAVHIITECITQSDFIEWILLDTQFEQLLLKFKEFKS